MSPARQLSPLESVERWTLVCSAVLITVALACLGARAQLGICLGAGLMALNARLLRQVGTYLARRYRNRPPPLGLVLGLLHVKLLALAVIMYGCMRYLPLDALAFLLGVSVLPAGILLAALSRGLGLVDDPVQPPARSGQG